MDIDVAFTGVPVSTLPAGRDFFERLFGRPADVVASEEEEMWRVTESAWLYIRVDAPRAGNGLAAFAVADLDAALADLDRRGIRPNLLEEFEAGRKATLRDLDGNTVAIIQVR